MLAKLLTPRIAGAIGGILLAISLASGVFAYIQTERLEAANATIANQRWTLDAAQDIVDNQHAALTQKDAVIRQQSEGLEAVLKSRWQDRQAYLANYAAADKRAQGNDARAVALLKSTAAGDELAQCRAARALLEKELTE